MRALFSRLHSWVIAGEDPPPSRYPKLSDATLLPEQQLVARFPFVPNMPSPAGIPNPTLVYDFGPQFHANDLSGFITHEPPAVVGVLATVLPSVDADGNETVGVETVQAQVPLGTYLGWNVNASGFWKGDYCSLTGSYVPFQATKQDRLAAHDARLSLEERYGTHQDYERRVRQAAEQSVHDGFLLPDDAEKLIRQARESDVLRGKRPDPPGSTQ